MKNIAIIGGGPAGLTAALELLKSKHDYKVTIYEKTDSVGGLAKTFIFEGNRVDVGGHRYFSKSQLINSIWEETLAVVNSEFSLVERNSHIYYDNRLVEYPIRITVNLLKAIGFKDSVNVVISYIHSIIFKRDERTLEDYFINHFGKKLYSMFFETYSLKLWGIHPSELSADWGAQRVRKISVFEIVRFALLKNSNKPKEKSFIEQFLYPEYGSGYMWDSMAKMIQQLGGKICLNAAVSEIERLNCGKYSLLINNHNERIQADIVISSMPLRELVKKCMFMPTSIKRIAEGLQFRDMVIVAVSLPSRFTGDVLKKAIKDSWIYVQEEEIKFGRVQILNNWSIKSYANEESILLELEYFCTEGDSLWNMTKENLLEISKSGLEKMHLIKQNAFFDSHFIKRIEKAYPVYNGTYSELEKIRKLINEMDDFFCIGRNGQHRYNNMDHSMLTSIKAVEVILNKNADKNCIWEVNSEQDYHEREKWNKKDRKHI